MMDNLGVDQGHEEPTSAIEPLNYGEMKDPIFLERLRS
jgi:hypothetical protein